MVLSSFTSRLLACFVLALVGCAGQGSSSRSNQGLPGLMVERLAWMNEVAKVKLVKSLPVTDAKREADLLDSMERLGAETHIPSAAVRAFFIGQMEAAKRQQLAWMRVHSKEELAGRTLPDLTKTVRPALDTIGKTMIAELAKGRRTEDKASIVSAARASLVQAGYGEAVINPAIEGLQAGLH